MEKTGRFLAGAGEQPPVIMCERHTKVFESAMTAANVPHTIYEFDDEDPSQYCQACDLQVAKAYAKKIAADAQPRIIVPGEFY